MSALGTRLRSPRSLWGLLFVIGTLSVSSCDKGNTLLLQVTADGDVEKFKLFIRDNDARAFVYQTPEWTDATKMGTISINQGEHGIGVRLDHPGNYSVVLFGLKGNVPCLTGGADLGVPGDGGMPDFGSGTAYFWAMSGPLTGNEEIPARLLEVRHSAQMSEDKDCDLFPDVNSWPLRVGAAATSIPTTLLDCNDQRPDINPFATEACGVMEDQDCDGKLPPSVCTDSDGDGDPDGSDCAPMDPKRHHPNAKNLYPELPNCCGYAFNAVDAALMRQSTHMDTMSYAMAAECRVGTCGAQDYDCDGKPIACVIDEDCDKAPPPAGAGKCEKTAGNGVNDCDDCNPAIGPKASEVCGDGIDNDCDGQVDDGCVTCDLDGDGFEREEQGICPTPNYPANKPRDCNDDDSGIFPAFMSAPASIRVPVPLMGLGVDTTCDPANAAHSVACSVHGFCRLNAGKQGDVDCEAAYNLASCPQPVTINGVTTVCDADKDGFIDRAHKAECDPNGKFARFDCDDTNAAIYPGAPDLCGDGKAWNCDADIPCTKDPDGDGYIDIWDCDNNRKDVHPNAIEVCDGVDNDCDGLIDEGNPNATTGETMGTVAAGNFKKCNTSGVGECASLPAKGPPPHCVCSRFSVKDNYFTGPQQGDNARVLCPDDASDERNSAKAGMTAPRCYFAVQPRESGETCDTKDTSCTRFKDFEPADHKTVLETTSLDDHGPWKDRKWKLTDCTGTTAAGGLCCPPPATLMCHDAQVEPLHCGNCNQQCATQNGVPGCAAGKCTIACSAGFANCDNTVDFGMATPGRNGCEINTATDAKNCGAGGAMNVGCGCACSTQNGAPTCSGGTCSAIKCNQGFANCNNVVGNSCGGNGGDGCEASVFTDVQNCGIGGDTSAAQGCGQQCSTQNGKPSCAMALVGGVPSGKCSIVCDQGFANCDNVVNTAKGAPGNNGCEIAVFTDVLNCGEGGNDSTAPGCGKVCSTQNGKPSCAMGMVGGRPSGVCAISCNPGFGNCNNVVGNSGANSDGCEVNTLTSAQNCGAGGPNNTGCGCVCATQNGVGTCNNGTCAIACNANFGNCDNVTGNSCNGNGGNGCETDLRITAAHCGGCGMACSANHIAVPVCAGSQCTGSCDLGFADCNANKRSDGCEIDITVSALHCGGCGQACSLANITPVCANSSCQAGVCNPNFADCNGDKRSDGCEVNLLSTVAHCGGCGMACSANRITPICANGNCNSGVCAANFGDCDLDKRSNGCETDLLTTVAHCGGCNMACSANRIAPACTGGACTGVCNMNFGDCNNDKRSDGCETDLLTTVAHCGGCNAACSANRITPVCAAGNCNSGICQVNWGDCNGDKRADGCETDLLASATNCGGCGMACSTNNITRACSGGACTGACTAGFGDCNNDKRADGCEININTNASHCGGCGMACSAANITPACTGGNCTGVCAANFGDCNSDKRADGCETPLQTTVAHCGGCGQACSSANIAPACSGGNCTGVCNAGFADCNGNKRSDGCEINTNTNASHCGGCNQACSSANITPACTGGNCTGVCAANFADCDSDKRSNGCECNLNTSQCSGAQCLLKLGQACVSDGQCASNKCCGVCVDIATDVNHCGGCGLACGAKGNACAGGMCTCGGGAACNTNQSAGGGQRCTNGSGNFRCECDATSCANGCCSAVVGGTCNLGTSNGSCGKLGVLCTDCTVGVDGNLCIAQVCGCNSTVDCPGAPLPRYCDTGTKKCSDTGCDNGTKACNGGCCDNSVMPSPKCVAGTANGACGGDGKACAVCTNPKPTCVANACQ